MMQILTSNALDYIIDHKKRMPDWVFKRVLDSHKAGLPSIEALKNALGESTAPPPSIVLPGGAEVDGPTMKKIVTPHSEDRMQRQAISLQAYAGHESDDDEEEEEEGEEKAEWIKMPDGSLKKLSVPAEKKTYVNEDEERMIENIVARYAEESAVDEAKKEDDELLL